MALWRRFPCKMNSNDPCVLALPTKESPPYSPRKTPDRERAFDVVSRCSAQHPHLTHCPSRSSCSGLGPPPPRLVVVAFVRLSLRLWSCCSTVPQQSISHLFFFMCVFVGGSVPNAVIRNAKGQEMLFLWQQGSHWSFSKKKIKKIPLVQFGYGCTRRPSCDLNGFDMLVS